jgi:hypothetical protein
MSKIPAQLLPASAGYTTASSFGTTVSSGAGGATGSWTQLISSLPQDAIGFYVSTNNISAGTFKVEIGIGAAASEVSLGEVSVSLNNSYVNNFVPIPIPAGSRVSARSSGGNVDNIAVHIIPVRGYSIDRLAANGIMLNWSNANGLGAIDPGTTANTLGSWTQLTASTSRDIVGYSLLFDIKGNAGGIWGLDVGVGAAASEIVVLQNMPITSEAFRSAARPSIVGPIWTPIPAGSRIAVRCQCSINTATDRNLGVGMVLWE